MNTPKFVTICHAAFAMAAGLSLTVHADDPPNVVRLTPGDVTWSAYPLRPGAQVAVIDGDMKRDGAFTVRLKFPACFSIPPHWHPYFEEVTVISGTLYSGLGNDIDKVHAKEMPAGSIILMPARTVHYAFTKEETVIEVHGAGLWGSFPPADLSK